MYLEENVTAEAVDMVEYVAINLTINLTLFLTPVFQYLWLCYLYWIISSFSPSTWLFPISVHLLSIPETYFLFLCLIITYIVEKLQKKLEDQGDVVIYV